jgi:hypothetical protein
MLKDNTADGDDVAVVSLLILGTSCRGDATVVLEGELVGIVGVESLLQHHHP